MALPLALPLALAVAGCGTSGDAPKPAPSGVGQTDIFGSAPLAMPSARPDAGPPAAADAGAQAPLMRVMKNEITTAYAAKNGPALAAAFQSLAAQAPTGYTNWASISVDAAAAVKAGEWKSVKAACRSCHAQYQTQYAAEHRQDELRSPDGGR